ncbi:MAG: hypothetical protein QOJ50_1741 [Cryptosporangiaceae bacterium]|jgi:hypothetical protein|nr:hypothetical protein [Cryptosporangiaceae bacterium]
MSLRGALLEAGYAWAWYLLVWVGPPLVLLVIIFALTGVLSALLTWVRSRRRHGRIPADEEADRPSWFFR